MRSKAIWIVLLLMLAIGAVVFFKSRKNAAKAAVQKETTAKIAAGGATRVEVTVVNPTRLDNTLTATGSVLANDEVEIRSEVNGRVQKIYFKEGAPVSQGQLLVKLNDADLQAQLMKLHQSRKLAEARENRGRQLLAKEGVSREEYDVLVNELESVKADIALVQAQIAKTELRAPFSGIIGLKSISEGSYLSPANRIAGLQQISPVKLDFSVPEQYMGQIHNGDAVTFTVQGQPGEFKAKVIAIEPKIDMGTRTVQIRALCDNRDNKVLPGAFAQVRLTLSANNQALMVPTEAVMPDLKGQRVFITDGGKAKPALIQTGARNDSAVQVISGIKPGDTVITSGVLYLKPGGKVIVTGVRK